MLKQTQRNNYDCCLASAASLTNTVYEDVFSPEFQAYIEEKKGTYGKDIDRVFNMVGLHDVDYKHIVNYFGPGTEDWEKHIRQHVINGMLWGRRALLQVPSLNDPGKSHLIVWNYFELWDPSTRKTYTDLGEFIPEHIWLVAEHAHQID
jgi:hypothetical protein